MAAPTARRQDLPDQLKSAVVRSGTGRPAYLTERSLALGSCAGYSPHAGTSGRLSTRVSP